MSTSMPNPIAKLANEPDFAAFLSIDWGNQKHVWKLAPTDSGAEQGELENTPEAVHAWAAGLHQRFAGRPIAVCLEQSRGPLVYMLSQYSHLVLYPVHPTMAARYRRAFHTSGAKADPSDAASLLDLLLRHREELRPLAADDERTCQLRLLTEHRRCMVDDKTRLKQRLIACLKQYFPQLLDWFDEVDSPLVGVLLRRWPTLQQLRRAHPGTLRRFFHEQNCRGEERIQKRIDAIYAAVPATQDTAMMEALSGVACDWAATLATLRERIAKVDLRIAELVADHPDRALFASLPGAGPALLPRLLVAFGADRNRYANAGQVQCLSGIAPVIIASGRTRSVHFRHACAKFLRQTFHEFAFCSLRKSVWAEAFYQHQREKNKSHHTAVRALAYKWIRIIFRCWKDGKPYDELAYLETLQKRNSPLKDRFASATPVEWKTVAGFKTLSSD